MKKSLYTVEIQSEFNGGIRTAMIRIVAATSELEAEQMVYSYIRSNLVLAGEVQVYASRIPELRVTELLGDGGWRIY